MAVNVETKLLFVGRSTCFRPESSSFTETKLNKLIALFHSCWCFVSLSRAGGGRRAAAPGAADGGRGVCSGPQDHRHRRQQLRRRQLHDGRCFHLLLGEGMGRVIVLCPFGGEPCHKALCVGVLYLDVTSGRGLYTEGMASTVCFRPAEAWTRGSCSCGRTRASLWSLRISWWRARCRSDPCLAYQTCQVTPWRTSDGWTSVDHAPSQHAGSKLLLQADSCLSVTGDELFRHFTLVGTILSL